MGVWLKHKLNKLASFGPYISIFSGHGSWNLGVVYKIVGVATQKWAWSKMFLFVIVHFPGSLLTNLATMISLLEESEAETCAPPQTRPLNSVGVTDFSHVHKTDATIFALLRFLSMLHKRCM